MTLTLRRSCRIAYRADKQEARVGFEVQASLDKSDATESHTHTKSHRCLIRKNTKISFFNIRIPTPPIVLLVEFFHADAVASDHPLPILCILVATSSWNIRRSWMHIMSVSCLIAEEISSNFCFSDCRVAAQPKSE